MKKIFITFALILIFFGTAQISQAEAPQVYKGLLPGPTTTSEYKTFVAEKALPGLTKVFLGIVGSAAVLFIIIGGMQYIGAMGNEEITKKATKTITWAVIGLLIAIASYAIVNAINNIGIGGTQATSSVFFERKA